MSYSASANRPNPVAAMGAIGIPAACGVLLVTGLTVIKVITPPAPNPTGVPVEVPIDPIIEDPVPDTASSTSSTTSQTTETVFTRPDTTFDWEMSSTDAIEGLPDLGDDTDVGIGPIVFGIPTPTPSPTFDPISASPQGNPGRWITDSDYRTSWINRGYEGTANFALTIDAEGRVTDCRITGSTGYAALDNATCRLIERRADFTPARDTSGNTTAGTFSSSVTWQIPE